MQGDVFQGVNVPGFEDVPALAMVMMHPCSMRTGTALRDRLIFIRVCPHQALPLARWPGGHYDFMPLPDLLGDGIGDHSLAACFRDIGSVESVHLDLRKRIAVLSVRGILYLQQRYIHSQTRVIVELETLLAQMAPILDEMELQEEWAEAALEANESVVDEIASINIAEAEFQNFLSANDDNLRSGLKDPLRRTQVRRAVRDEVRRRYPAT